ncbi:MAG: T9SS type A sorting domain-containing protein [Candidatus Marinimicrobia bacterium]|nr:T9SS type A sorting domain-containing protein [Candidatus Neomarinimicrobiota bacterium]
MIRNASLCLISALQLSFATGQEIDTISYYNPDSLFECMYTGDLLNLGVIFEPNPQWSAYDVIALEIQYPGVGSWETQDLIIYDFQGDSFPGLPLDTISLSVPTESDIWPNWMHYDLRNIDVLQDKVGSFSVTGSVLMSGLCDESYPSGNSRSLIFGWENWWGSNDFPIRAILEHSPVSINENTYVPHTINIEKAYPNPFNPEINFRIRAMTRARIDFLVYDIQGRLIDSWWTDAEIGITNQLWTPKGLRSGLYFITIKSGESLIIQKVTYLQ